ncbi:hypothetical protein C0995_004184 [Termitomyces sp. Mi166|nr:hypothetical protein C0995_004184 [Termitomyces sp. Mi166\
MGSKTQQEDGYEDEFISASDSESSNKAIECLAQAFAANSQPKPLHSTVSHHLQDFEDVSSKALFDSLPEHKQWDHVIELVLDAEPSSCKVYPFASWEQDNSMKVAGVVEWPEPKNKKKVQAFDALKQAVTSLVLLHAPFHVEADSSDFATEVVLSQQSKKDGKWHPIVFYLKSLNAVEQNYKIHNKMLMII